MNDNRMKVLIITFVIIIILCMMSIGNINL